MAHSIEARFPFLDYRLVEFSFTWPDEEKLSQGITKRILRSALKDVLPEAILNRRTKVGFYTMPASQWLKTSFRELIGDIIHTPDFESRPYFNAKRVQKGFEAHCHNSADFGTLLWQVVLLELWLRAFFDESPLKMYASNEPQRRLAGT